MHSYFKIPALTVALSLTACAAPLLPASSAQQNGGCINKELNVCLNTLKQTLVMMPDEIPQKLAYYTAHKNQTDVNGKPLGGTSKIIISGYIPSRGTLSSIILELDKNDHVTKASGTLPLSPSIAITHEMFAKTGLYEMSAILLGTECPNLTESQTEKFFYNDVKPKITNDKKKTTFHDTSVDVAYAERSPSLDFCGKKFSYYALSGYDTENISLENRHGVYMYPTIAFE